MKIKTPLTLVFVVLLFISHNSFSKIKVTNPESWVKRQIYNTLDTIPLDQVREGAYYMLIDRQLNLISKQYYYHYAYRVQSENGVQNNSEISIDYNPAYQKFFLHMIKIVRNDKTIDCISSSKIKEIQQERDLDSHIYDETKTVYIILKDVRPNDIIEYDYTLEGVNPIFNNSFYTTFTPNYEYTLLNFYWRLLKLNISVKVYHRFRSKVYHPKRDQFVM